MLVLEEIQRTQLVVTRQSKHNQQENTPHKWKKKWTITYNHQFKKKTTLTSMAAPLRWFFFSFYYRKCSVLVSYQVNQTNNLPIAKISCPNTHPHFKQRIRNCISILQSDVQSDRITVQTTVHYWAIILHRLPSFLQMYHTAHSEVEAVQTEHHQVSFLPINKPSYSIILPTRSLQSFISELYPQSMTVQGQSRPSA